jgi:hypothetical protein
MGRKKRAGSKPVRKPYSLQVDSQQTYPTNPNQQQVVLARWQVWIGVIATLASIPGLIIGIQQLFPSKTESFRSEAAEINARLFETSVEALILIEPSNATYFGKDQHQGFHNVVSTQLVPMGLVRVLTEKEMITARDSLPGALSQEDRMSFLRGGFALTEKGLAIREYVIAHRPLKPGKLIFTGDNFYRDPSYE